MIRFINHKCFNMSLYRNILVNDPIPFDSLINDIPSRGIHEDVSDALQIPYLSKYEGGKQQLTEKVKYQGKIIGDHSRLFFSIPTARRNCQEYYYVHYLLATGSPYTTLTRQCLCCLFGKNVDDNVVFPSLLTVLIGGNVVQTRLSNPPDTKQEDTHNYHNVNLLGQNFMRSFRMCKLEQNFKTKQALLELIQ